jgi:hypothetical protein
VRIGDLFSCDAYPSGASFFRTMRSGRTHDYAVAQSGRVAWHIAHATRTWARSGRPTRSFMLVHLGGLRSAVDHPGWDSSWPIPSEHDIDDLAELGLLRVEPFFDKRRTFVLSVKGAQVAADLHRTGGEGPFESGRRDDGTGEHHPTAFVSWAHDDPAWESTVYDFVRGLYANGIEAEVDLFHLSDPHVNWADYGPRAVEAADYVLIAVSAAYKRRWDGAEDPTVGAGATSEANTLKSIFGDNRAEFQRKVKVVVLPGASEDDIPLPIKAPISRFRIDPQSNLSFEGLLRMLTGQHAFDRPALSSVPALPPRVADVSTAPATGDDAVQLVAFIDQLRDSLAELGNGYLGTEHAHLYGVVLSKVKNAQPGNEFVSGLAEPQPTAMSGVYRPTAPEARAALDAMRAALGAPPSAAAVPQPAEPGLDPELLRGRIFPNSYASCVDASQIVLVVRAGMAARLPVEPAPAIDSDDEQAFLDLVAGSSLEGWVEQATITPGERWRPVHPSGTYSVTLRRPPAPSDADGWEVGCQAFLTVAPYHFGRVAGHGYLLLDVLVRPTADEPVPPMLSVQELFDQMVMLPAVLVAEVGGMLFPRLSRGADSDVLSAIVLVQSYGRSLGGFVKLEHDGWTRTEGSHDRQGGEWEPIDYAELVSPDRRAESLRAWFKKLLRESGIRGHEADIDGMPTPVLPDV